jgi:hypothetical protein
VPTVRWCLPHITLIHLPSIPQFSHNLRNTVIVLWKVWKVWKLFFLPARRNLQSTADPFGVACAVHSASGVVSGPPRIPFGATCSRIVYGVPNRFPPRPACRRTSIVGRPSRLPPCLGVGRAAPSRLRSWLSAPRPRPPSALDCVGPLTIPRSGLVAALPLSGIRRSTKKRSQPGPASISNDLAFAIDTTL